MDLSNVDDKEILTRVRVSVKNEKKCTLEVLEYLTAVNQRRLHLSEGYSSLHDFCIRYLRYSEGEANRRVHAARALWKFEEAVRPVLENNEISLTGLCLLSSHLTAKNVLQLLNESKNLTTRQIEKVISKHFPETRRLKSLAIELDEELEILLEKAKLQLSEKLPAVILKKALRELTREKRERPSAVVKHTRYVQARTRREIMKQDSHQCSFRSSSGVRCNQTAYLQVDHIRPYALGGSSQDRANLRTLCRAHNLLKAKLDFPNIARYSGELANSRLLSKARFENRPSPSP